MAKAPFTYERTKLMPGFDGKVCKIYPHLVQTEKYTYMTYGTLLLSGSDVAQDSYFVRSVDGGKTFGAPELLGCYEVKKDGIAEGSRTLVGFKGDFRPYLRYFPL